MKIEAVNFAQYQQRVLKFAVYPGSGTASGLAYAALGLNGEAGEVAEHAKKNLRDDDGLLTPERREKILKELGDVLWYLSATADECGISLQEVAEENISKLQSRYDRGRIHGDGDNR